MGSIVPHPKAARKPRLPVPNRLSFGYTLSVQVIVNPAAAGGRVGRELSSVLQRLRNVGFDQPHVLTEAPGHATALAAEAVRRGAQVVVAAGGDGTICEVVQGLRDAGGGTLGILPLGTGNDAARTLGLPLRLEAAAELALNGLRRRVDLMKVGDRVVLNAIGIGLLGDINVSAAAIKVVRGLGAYLVAAVGSLASYPAPPVRLRADGFDYDGSMLILAVHNGPTTGGGFRLTPSARPDDGKLDACLVANLAVPKRVHRLVTALRGTLERQPGSHAFRFTRLDLACEVALPAHLDGNPWMIEPPGATIEILPGALEIVAPPNP